MRRGVWFPAWYPLLVAVLGILSGCQSLRDLERFAIRHHAVPFESLGMELRRPSSHSSFRYFFHQVDVAVRRQRKLVRDQKRMSLDTGPNGLPTAPALGRSGPVRGWRSMAAINRLACW
jgi:hypothetical protein